LSRIRQAARRDKRQQFTALWHHVYDVRRLEEAYLALNRKGAAGVDQTTWAGYDENLEANLEDLSSRLQRGAYRASPVRRVYIPKEDGRKRPIGVPTLEDKIVQRATAQVLNAIYEEDFFGFSYGFRPGRSQHNALDAVAVGLLKRKVNWVLDADIRGFLEPSTHYTPILGWRSGSTGALLKACMFRQLLHFVGKSMDSVWTCCTGCKSSLGNRMAALAAVVLAI
jgi:retron-type reverse transcriptase